MDDTPTFKVELTVIPTKVRFEEQDGKTVRVIEEAKMESISIVSIRESSGD